MTGIDCVMVKTIGGRAVYISGDGFMDRARKIVKKRVAKGERLDWVEINFGILEIHTTKAEDEGEYNRVSKIRPGYQMTWFTTHNGKPEVWQWYKEHWHIRR